MDYQNQFNEAFNIDPVNYPQDCKRIAEVVRHYYDVFITPRQAEIIWQEHSDMYNARWLFVPDDDQDIINAIEHFLRKRE